MSNTVITNYTDLNGPSTKADSSVVVIVNKDGSLSVDQNLLGTLMGTDGSQSSGISVVRVGHEGRPDDATDSENEDDDKIPHVTLTVDSYYNEPNSIIKYDSGAEMLQSLRIETRENSLVGFHNDHCYTPLVSPSQVVSLAQKDGADNFSSYKEPVLQISHTPPPKPVPSNKKITILEQKIIPKGKKIQIKSSDSPVILKGNDVLKKPLPVMVKPNELHETDKIADSLKRLEESTESSSTSSSCDSVADRDSDSDYKDQKVASSKPRKIKLKPRILKTPQSTKPSRLDIKSTPKMKQPKVTKREIKEKTPHKVLEKKIETEIDLESLLPSSKIAVTPTSSAPSIEFSKTVLKQTPKPIKKEKKTPAHVTALLSDMTSLFSTPDVIRRVSTENKTPGTLKETPSEQTPLRINVGKDTSEGKPADNNRVIEINRGKITKINNVGNKDNVLLSPSDKAKGCDLIPQIDDASLAQILQETESITSNSPKPLVANVMNSPGIGPMSPTLDLGLQPTGLDDGLSDDLLAHVAHLVQNSKLQEVIDTQVLKIEPPAKKSVQSPFQQAYSQSLAKSAVKQVQPKEKPIQIVKSDGRVITLPPIEAPATRSSKRKSQMESSPSTVAIESPKTPAIITPLRDPITPEPQMVAVSKQYVNKKLPPKKLDMQELEAAVLEKSPAESQESWNSEDDPYRLWCICKQPHNNRFMICCDSCEDWFHGKCVNITKAMGQQMEEQGIEWRCPNCIKKTKSTPKSAKSLSGQKKHESPDSPMAPQKSPFFKQKSLSTCCIVCKKPARASSIYCGNACILKHAQDSLRASPTKADAEPGKAPEKPKTDSSRVIVYERISGRLLAGPNAPTAGELKSWLQKNPTFEVVRPGALSSIRPGLKKKPEPRKIQTTLNFDRVPKNPEQSSSSPVRIPQSDVRDRRLLLSRRDNNPAASPKPATPKSNPIQLIDTPRPSTSTAKPVNEPRKLSRGSLNRSQSNEKPAGSPTVSRRKDPPPAENKSKMNSVDPIRDNVRKSLQEQMSLRMKESKGAKFTEDEIQQFANDTELELHDLFKDVGIKYKAKYRSLMFNIKDRKNLSLWEKIRKKSLTPQQLVRLTPEEMASQELSEWRDQESKYQLELIKKSELDLLAASKTYVLKTHKGEEVMETKESVSTELDPNVPVEDVVIALNDSTVGEEVTREVVGEIAKPKSEEKKDSKSKKRGRDESSSRTKKSRRNSSPAERRKSRRDSDRKSRSSRRKSEYKEKESRSERRSTRRADKKSRTRSTLRDRLKRASKDKSDSERSRRRSRSKEKTKRSKSRDKSRSASKTRDKSRSNSKTRDEPKSREKSRSASKGREKERSRSIERSTDAVRRRSSSKEAESRTRRSRSKPASGDEKSKRRSRSQDNSYSKNKTDSTDSDSIERPKSASLKEPHPEYDPHEPMITSAFSEEDLRKSEDAFEDTYKSEILDSGIEYDPTKMFTLDSSILPSTTFVKQDKSAEAESDQEPSSTVDTAGAVVWNGCINMVDVARFYVSAHEVTANAMDLEEELSAELDIVGRINPETVWDYINKTKKGNNKDIELLKLQAANDEEKMQYIALYSYLSSRNRLGVVKVPNSATIKDFYIIPLPANTSLPKVLLPLNGPGLGDGKTHLLIAVIVRQKKKRLAPNIPKDIIPAKVARESRKRSYTPPVVSKSSYTPPTSPRRRAMPLPSYPASSLSTSVKDKIAASLACADEGNEAYSPGDSSSSSNGAPPAPAVIAPPGPAAATVLRSKMEELNRQIEEQKQQIMKMAQADSSMGGGDDEAYSPSRPMTPPPAVSTLADISLPSNLHEILATIKQRSENQTTDVDMRNLPS